MQVRESGAMPHETDLTTVSYVESHFFSLTLISYLRTKELHTDLQGNAFS